MKPGVLFLPNAFDHTKREIYPLKRAASVRHIARTTLRHKTGIHMIDGRRRRVFNQPTVCFYNGRKIVRAQWRHTIVRPGDVVSFHTLPEGGGGDGGGSQIIQALAMVAVMIAAPYIGGPLAAALEITSQIGISMVTAAVGLALSAAVMGISSLFVQTPPPQQAAVTGGYGDTGQVSPTYSANATGNIARLGQPIPAAFGLNLHVPDYVSAPYVRYVDNDQYVFMLLGIGQGEYEISQVKIGDTPIEAFTDVEWEHIQPNTYPSLSIADTRIITSADVSDIELQDAAAGSPWVGPFAVNPSGTVVDRCEIDRTAPRGLFNGSSGSIVGLSVNTTIQAQPIDDSGAAIGSWSTLATDTKSGPSTNTLFWTDTFVLPSAGRWQVRMKRTDTMNTSSYAGHRLDWIGLKGRLTTFRRFSGMTCLGVKARITSQLNARTLLVKVLATRKLPTWNPTLNGGLGGMTTATVATRNPCDAYAEIARNTLYGCRIPDAKIDLAGIYALKDSFDALGWTFDYVYDQTLQGYEALSRVARAVIAQTVVQGGKLRLVRNVPNEAPVMMFTPDNTRAGSVNIDWAMVDNTTADCLIGEFMNPNSWKADFLTAAFDDSPQENPSNMVLYGVTNRAQAWAILWNYLRSNRFQRRTVSWDTEMEGLILQFGDRVSFSTDIAKWGQSGTIVAWDDTTRVATLSQAPDFSAGGTHYIGLRDHLGHLMTPLVATGVVGKPYQVTIGAGDLPDIYLGGDTEPTYYQFGPGEKYARRLIVRTVTPRKDNWATITGIDDDLRIFAELPPLPLPSVGEPAPDLEVHVTKETAKLNLRTFCDDIGFVGVPTQQMTIFVDAECYSDDPTVAAITRGTWPTGYSPIVVINVPPKGAGGKGGDGKVGVSASGQAGGPALDMRSGPVRIKRLCNILGGGGGGGGGGAGFSFNEGLQVYDSFGGGGGAGGRGRRGGDAGLGGSGSVENGGNATAGSPSSAGTRGAGSTFGGPGGDGGDFGVPGTAGVNGVDNSGGQFVPYYIGGPGGAAGAAVLGNSNITWDPASTGSFIGPVVP